MTGRTSNLKLKTQPVAASVQVKSPRVTQGFDVMTLTGFSLAILVLSIVMALGHSFRIFFDFQAILIVVGGTIGVIMVCYSFDDLKNIPSSLSKALFEHKTNYQDLGKQLMGFSKIAREGGFLKLDPMVTSLKGQVFLKRALMMVCDGTSADEIEKILTSQIEAIRMRHTNGANILKRAAETAPVTGLIGTLIGLVQMLSNLNDPATIGPNMAVALLTTFYGAVFGSMIFNPLGVKLEQKSDHETLMLNLCLTGALSMARQENPRRLELMLNTLLPPDQRLHFYK